MMYGKKKLLDILIDKLPLSGKSEEITFKPGGELTLGVEVELQLLDPESLNLVQKAEEIIRKAPHLKRLKPEFFLNAIEINTEKCANVHEVEGDLANYLDELDKLGNEMGICFSTTGCHPFARYADAVITPSERYYELIDRNQWLARRLTIYGLHIHIGMKSGDDCIRFNNFFAGFTPHLLALSASSPYWQGEDTGLATCRSSAYEALPTAGQPYNVRNWREFEELYYTLKKCGSIKTMKDLWWDVRPSPKFGTLEIRICDGLPSLAGTLAIVAYVHLLAHWFNDNGGWLNHVPVPSHWQSRENKWRAMRHGLDATLISSLEGDVIPLREDISNWLEKLEPYAEKLGYTVHLDMIRQIMEKGNSSTRQRAVFEKTGSLKEVCRHNVEEFKARRPNW